MGAPAQAAKVPARFSTTVIVPEDVLRFHGSVLVPAGVYNATPDEEPEEWARVKVPSCTVWVPSGNPCRLCSGTGTRPDWDAESIANGWAEKCGGCNGCSGTGDDATPVALPAYHYTRTEAPPMPIPEHECYDCARSGVVDGFYCSVCHAELDL